MFTEVCVSSAYSFECEKLRVNYGILHAYRVTAGIVKVAVGICGFLVYGSKDFVLSYLKFELCELEDDVLNELNVQNSHSILSNNDNIVPGKWKHSIIVSIPKMGNSSSLENQRGIAKSCDFAKLTNKLLLASMRDIIELQLLGVQSGF